MKTKTNIVYSIKMYIKGIFFLFEAKIKVSSFVINWSTNMFTEDLYYKFLSNYTLSRYSPWDAVQLYSTKHNG